MKISKLMFYGFMMIGQLSYASMYDELIELKKICDAQLLTTDECASRKEVILNKTIKKPELWFCSYAGEATPPQPFSAMTGNSFSESSSTSSIVKDILDEAGLAPNFIVRPANVPNAMASSYDGHRFIEYNPNFIQDMKSNTQTNWTVYSIMAHEIGHHLQGHTIQAGGSRPDIELEADEYSGFILAKLGADLSQSQLAMKTLGSDETSGTHPGTKLRLDAIEKGWHKGFASKGQVSASSQQAEAAEMPKTVEQHVPEMDEVLVSPEVYVTELCVIEGQSVLITDGDALLSYAMDYMQIGERQAPVDDACFFDLVTVDGRYCVVETGQIYFGTEDSVGQCEACDEELCAGL